MGMVPVIDLGGFAKSVFKGIADQTITSLRTPETVLAVSPPFPKGKPPLLTDKRPVFSYLREVLMAMPPGRVDVKPGALTAIKLVGC
jgi:hypothetical protein